MKRYPRNETTFKARLLRSALSSRASVEGPGRLGGAVLSPPTPPGPSTSLGMTWCVYGRVRRMSGHRRGRQAPICGGELPSSRYHRRSSVASRRRIDFQVVIHELQVVQLPIDAAARQELLVPPHFDDRTFVEHHDLVRAADRG